MDVHFTRCRFQVGGCPALKRIDARTVWALVFTFGIQMTFEPVFYKTVFKFGMNHPYLFQSDLVGVGKSTLYFEDKFISTSGQLLVEEKTTFVHVDPKTRKPKPHPKAELGHFDPKLKSYRGPKFHHLHLPTAKNVYYYQCSITQCDIDHYLHTARYVYMRLAMNAGNMASTSGFYTSIKGELAGYRVKQVTVVYKGETVAGDKLDIYTWQDEQDDYKLYFKIKKKNSDVTDCTIEFYPITVSML